MIPLKSVYIIKIDCLFVWTSWSTKKQQKCFNQWCEFGGGATYLSDQW